MRLTLSAFIFDLDGTLADSIGDIGAAMNHALEAHGHPPHTIADYLPMVGEGVRRLAERAVPKGLSSESVDRVLATYRARYAQALVVNTRAYAGIDALLASLVAKRVPLAVLSNKGEAFTRPIVASLFPNVPFVDVRGDREGVPRKPDPGAALELARALGHAANEVAFVGDTAVDMETARRAGMVGVGVLWGFRGRDELLGAGAKVLLPHPSDLESLVDVRPGC